MRTQLWQMRLLMILFGIYLAVVPTLITLGTGWRSSLGDIEDTITGEIVFAALIPVCGLGLAMAIAQFGYLHKRQKLDYFHALPVSRESHFFGRVSAALVVLLAAAVLLTAGQSLAVVLAVERIKLPEFMRIFGGILQGSFAVILPAVNVYIFAALFVILTATVWEMIFSLLTISSVGMVVCLFTVALIENSIPVQTDIVPNAVGIVALTSPLVINIFYVDMWGTGESIRDMLLILGFEVLYIAVSGILAMVFFCRRKSELAESNMSTRFKQFMRAVAAMCTVMIFSWILWIITENYIGYLIGSVLGFAVAWLVTELIYNRSLRRMVKSLLPNAAGYGVFAVINILVIFGLVGVPKLPDVQNVNAISVSYGIQEKYSGQTESFDEISRVLFADGERHIVRAGSFDRGLVEDGHRLAKDILENQRELYFPYFLKPEIVPYDPALWQNGKGNKAVSITVKLHMDGDVIQYTFEDYAESGRIPQLYEDAKAISKALLYIQSDPVLTLMESMTGVEYDDYQSGGNSLISYKFSKLENKEDYIRRLQ